jgi:prepilin-type N-terminal cleavage/methylation domain-containing protein
LVVRLRGGIAKSGKRKAESRRAFTLIELLGVMAVIGILAAVVLPPMIARIEDAKMANEDVMLETISQALVKAIRTYQKFPNPNVAANDATFGWATLAKDFFPGGIDAIRYVFPKDQNFAQTERRVYLDPTLMAYLNANGFSIPSYGFPATDSDSDGTPDIDEMGFRLYLVSSSSPKLPLTCAANGANAQPAGSNYNQTLINDLLNWVKAYAAPGAANAGALIVPKTIANWSSVDGSNSRRGEYVHVKIVDLRGLMRRVVLTDYHNPMTGLGVANNFVFTPNALNDESKTINGYTLKWVNDSNGNSVLDYGGANNRNAQTGYTAWWQSHANYTGGAEPSFLTGNPNQPFWTLSIRMEPPSRGTKIPLSLFSEKISGDKDPVTGKNMYRGAKFIFDNLSPNNYFLAQAPYGPFYQIGNNSISRVTIYGNPNALGNSDETAQIDQADFYVFDGTPVRLYAANAQNGAATNGVTYPIKSNPTRFYYSQGTWTQED